MFDINAAIDELRAFEGDEETPKPSVWALGYAKHFAMWARHHRFDIESINADAMGGVGVFVKGVGSTEVWYCYLDQNRSETYTASSQDESPHSLPNRQAVARFLRGEPPIQTLAQFLHDFEERYWEVQVSLGRRPPTNADRLKLQRDLRLEALGIIIDTLIPELLKLAGNGLLIQGERRIRAALGIAQKGDDKAE